MAVTLKKLFLVILLIFLIGCVPSKDFTYGIKQINNINFKYNTTMETYPKSMQQINSMLADLEELKKLKLETGNEPLNYILDYRIINLEAENLFIISQEYGLSNIAKTGFACKPRPLILESVALRNHSAQKGFEAVRLLYEFTEKYPEEAKIAWLSHKNALFLNAAFYQLEKEARSDSNIINHFCPQNVTLTLYKEEFRKKTNLTDDFINNLSYEEAVPIWKNIRGIN